MTPLVMVVEDDQALCFIYKKVLEKLEVEVIQASDGAIALELLKTTSPDMIFLDILLPRVSGMDVLRYVADQSRLANCRIVIVTANPRFEAEAKRIRAVEFVAKPIMPDRIRACVTNSVV